MGLRSVPGQWKCGSAVLRVNFAGSPTLAGNGKLVGRRKWVFGRYLDNGSAALLFQELTLIETQLWAGNGKLVGRKKTFLLQCASSNVSYNPS